MLIFTYKKVTSFLIIKYKVLYLFYNKKGKILLILNEKL